MPGRRGGGISSSSWRLRGPAAGGRWSPCPRRCGSSPPGCMLFVGDPVGAQRDEEFEVRGGASQGVAGDGGHASSFFAAQLGGFGRKASFFGFALFAEVLLGGADQVTVRAENEIVGGRKSCSEPFTRWACPTYSRTYQVSGHMYSAQKRVNSTEAHLLKEQSGFGSTIHILLVSPYSYQIRPPLFFTHIMKWS